jgi:hypothetical protein
VRGAFRPGWQRRASTSRAPGQVTSGVTIAWRPPSLFAGKDRDQVAIFYADAERRGLLFYAKEPGLMGASRYSANAALRRAMRSRGHSSPHPEFQSGARGRDLGEGFDAGCGTR